MRAFRESRVAREQLWKSSLAELITARVAPEERAPIQLQGLRAKLAERSARQLSWLFPAQVATCAMHRGRTLKDSRFVSLKVNCCTAVMSALESSVISN